MLFFSHAPQKIVNFKIRQKLLNKNRKDFKTHPLNGCVYTLDNENVLKFIIYNHCMKWLFDNKISLEGKS